VKKPALVLAAATLTLGGCTKSAGMMQILGSNTMLEVAQAWSEAYLKIHPEVGMSVNGGGSNKGIAGIIDGTVDIANASRRMVPEEIEKAKKNGHDPVEHLVGYDGIAVFVHKDNPIESITMEQLKQIFADKGTVTKWSQLGVKLPDGMADDIVPVSRDSSSGTHESFQDIVLGGKAVNFRASIRELTSPTEIVDLVSKTRSAIGYSGLAAGRSDVRALPVVRKPGDKAVAPTMDTVLDKTYPISRALLVYTIGQPKGEVKNYLDWIVGDAGQHVLLDNHYVPLRKL